MANSGEFFASRQVSPAFIFMEDPGQRRISFPSVTVSRPNVSIFGSVSIPLTRSRSSVKHSSSRTRFERQNSRFQSIYDDINEKRKVFSPTLDLRGHRAEEALDELQHFLDDAQLLSEKELRILHGKGWGILKTIIRQRLQTLPEVQSFHSASRESGGDGVTVVRMK